jgi:two-component system response regulator ResD
MHILLIDDDLDITRLIKVMLKPLNAQVEVANSGQAGIELIRQISFDVVILDLLMPDMSGLEVCRALRKFTRVPILVLSALTNPRSIAEVLDAGADSCLTKPVSKQVLVSHLMNLVRRIQNTPAVA